MCDHVLSEVRLPQETHVALVAFECLTVLVDQTMVAQTAGTLEPFQTILALVLFNIIQRVYTP